MAQGKITISSINKLQGWLWDIAVIGFGARRQTNLVHYYVRYRHNGTQVVRSIGRHGALTPDTARAKAKQLLGVVAGGTDPFAQALSGEGFPAAVERYLERKKASLKSSSFAEAGRYLRGHAAPLHSLRLSQIDRRKVAALLGEIETSCGPVSRNRARSALSSFFSWCIQEGLIDVNPVTGTGKAEEGGSRERVLTQDELRKLWRGLGDDDFSNVLRLLLLLGQRRNEIGKLTWSEVDVGRIVLPAHRVKNGREHIVPLSRQASAILARQPRRNSTEFVFGKRGFTNWDGAKQELDKRIGIAPWRIHDLRRSCATYMGELGVLPHVVEQALNHVSGHKAGVAGTYNRSKMSDAVREALQRWADWLERIANSSLLGSRYRASDESRCRSRAGANYHDPGLYGARRVAAVG
jgi:integrase